MTSVGKSVPHDSAVGHVTGTAAYLEDLPLVAGELWVDFVGSPVAAGRLVSIDASLAAAMAGVVGVYTHGDIGGANRFGPIVADEPFLVEAEVAYAGQPVVVIAATSREVARRARDLVQLVVEPGAPILSIEDAVAARAYLGPTRQIARGDVDAAFDRAAHEIDGTFVSNGQEQFYFESQACRVTPGEQGELHVHSSTQNPTETQAVVAEVLGLGMHQVVCECKRMGGGFGGKETQSALAALMAGLVAQQTGRTARVVFRKDVDMLSTGKRHAYVSHYRLGFDLDGKIEAARFEFFSNGGAFADLSTSVMERTMLHADNAYYLPNVSIQGQVCRTNLPPNTAFRGFGGPQGVVVIENAMEEIARVLGLDALDVRKANLYRDGDASRNTTPYGQVIENHVLPEIFDELEVSSDYRRRVERIRAFNQASATHTKGLALSGIKFGISFTSKFLNQANALVNVYTDGSVQVSTGGTEMGQGLNTKIRQMVADEFGVEMASVLLMPTSTEKNNNTSPTAASAGTDLNGAAAKLACREIKGRMAGFAVELFASRFGESARGSVHDIGFAGGTVFDRRDEDLSRSVTFAELCDLARRERIDLGHRAFYATRGVDFDRETGRGTPFFYFTTGAAVAEVTVDRFTGELTVDRIDLLMDVGASINPGIDRGQVIGGFVQGMGWCTDEELVYDGEGKLLSTGPTTYKIPNITDVPAEFHVAFRDNPKHERNVHLSKAVGEPPLMLGIAPWLAAKQAVSAVEPNSGRTLRLPATAEEILLHMTTSRAD